MKTIKRVSSVLKVTGIVLICLSLVLWIYALSTSGTAWGTFSEQLSANGESAGFLTRVRFDSAYFNAMGKAADTKNQPLAARTREAKTSFQSFIDSVGTASTAKKEKQTEENLAFFENEFDYEAFLERFSEQDTGEARELREIFEYLDSLTVAAGKGKLSGLKAASSQDFFDPYYASFAQEHGEEAGTYVEFLTTVRSMIAAYLSEGGTLSAAKDYMTSGFDYDAYLAELENTKAAEKSAGAENFLDELTALAQAKLAGEEVSAVAVLQQGCDAVQARYPSQELGGMYAFTESMKLLLENSAFDGSYGAIADEMKTIDAATGEKGFSVFLDSFARQCVEDADSRSSVGIIRVLWVVAALYGILFVVGVALILLSILLKKILTARLLSKRENAGYQEESDVLLRVSHLKQYFRSGDYVNKAVDDVSFTVKKGEVFGLVGESGCGKTTTGRTIINLYDPTDGDVYFQGQRISSNQNGLPVMKFSLKKDCDNQIAALKEKLKEDIKNDPARKEELKNNYRAECKKLKGDLRDALVKAQDSALESFVEKSKCTQIYRENRKAEIKAAFEKDIARLDATEAAERKRQYKNDLAVADKDNMMTKMQMIFQDPIASINPRMTVREIIAEGLRIRGVKDKQVIDKTVYEMLELVGLVPEHADRYPHEFSGGQRQRIGIARAIALQPDLIIADEPISALDVSIQAQVINLLNDLRNKMGLTIIFIAHNLSVVKYFSDRIAVMYYGKIVEMTTSDELFAHPLHPYTKSLLSAIPYPDPHYEKQRRRIEYNPAKAHDYSKEQPTLKEIVPGHFIYCNGEELERYKKEMGI